MRRAVEQLGPAPLVADQNDDNHPFNRGLIWSSVGQLTVYMLTGEPGKFYLDMYAKQPATDAQAKAAFGLRDFNYYEHQARELEEQRRIDAEVDKIAAGREALAAGLQSKDETLKAKANRLAAEYLRTTAEVNQAREAERQHVAELRKAAQ